MMPAWCIKYPSIHMHLNSCYLLRILLWIMFLDMQEHLSQWSDSSFPHPADALYILLVLFILSLKLMMDSFVQGWFCGFSTGTGMGWGVSRGTGRLSPGQSRPGPFSQLWREVPPGPPRQGRHPAPAGGPTPGLPKPTPLLLARCCSDGTRAAALACSGELGVHHVSESCHQLPLPWNPPGCVSDTAMVTGNIPALAGWSSPGDLRPPLEPV